MIVSICPPHAALDVARACTGFGGIYVDANAISPLLCLSGPEAPSADTFAAAGAPDGFHRAAAEVFRR